MRYVGHQEVERYGRAEVGILGTSSVAERVIVVERAVQAAPVAGCPFSACGCERLRLDMPPGAEALRVDAVQLKHVKSVLCVEMDWVDCVRRHGLERIPASTPSTSEEYAARRMFVNCSGFCPQSRRGTDPSETPAQDAEQHKGERTQTPVSQGAERTRTPERTQKQRWLIRVHTMTPKHTLIYRQKRDAGRTQSRPRKRRAKGDRSPAGHVP